MNKSYCCLTADKNSFIIIEASYNEEFIAKLKALVPSEFRSYDQKDKKWTVHPRFTEKIKELAKAHFDLVWLIEGTIVADLHTGEVVLS